MNNESVGPFSPKGPESNNIPCNRGTCSKDINNYRSSTSNYFFSEQLSNAELFFSLVEWIEVLPTPGARHVCRLHLSGKDRALEIDSKSLEHYRNFQKAYYKAFGIWPPWIGKQAWRLVLESLMDLKIEGPEVQA